jgi:hypothetical protein
MVQSKINRNFLLKQNMCLTKGKKRIRIMLSRCTQATHAALFTGIISSGIPSFVPCRTPSSPYDPQLPKVTLATVISLQQEETLEMA